MWKLTSENAPFSLLKFAKYLLLVLCIVLIIANLHFLAGTRQHAQSYSEQQNQATWFLLQLTKEFTELNTITPFAADDQNYHDKVMLKYELTWSRFDLLLTSDEADSFVALPGARAFFTNLFTQFQSLEPKLEQLKTKQQAQLLGQEFDYIYRSMVRYVNTNFRVKSPLYEHQQTAASELHQMQLASLFLLIVCVMLATYILHKETEYHKQQSLTDSLTGIPNRLALFTDLRRKVASTQPFHLFLLDLNGFKEVNDQFGHQAGDRVLIAFAERLSLLDAECYRIGGDEFAIITTKIESQHVALFAHNIHQRMQEALIVTDGTVIHVSTSVGSAHFPHDTDDLYDLMLIADSNMYREKHTSRDTDISNTMG
ncbi:GGDEF domain-containing protein [Vibrio europaeus]|uniref:GGDEF domain-containing protein n=1 Tax=Vibrio europaeus TaxID=300876 RepID=UPI00148E3EC4|nr:GGDEF domain-containing protein [Vibrio europaeus]NOH22184.1 GGDEF domain-containing protein [Vibrio europaeus]